MPSYEPNLLSSSIKDKTIYILELFKNRTFPDLLPVHVEFVAVHYTHGWVNALE